MILTFKNPALLATALSHRSSLNEKGQSGTTSNESNERLEFLGDAVLELAATLYLYEHRPDEDEGKLTAYRSALVRTETLAALARELELHQQMYLSKGEEQGGGRDNDSLLADLMEAVIGALYLDQGFVAVQDFLTKHLFPKFETILKNKSYKDQKSLLQEEVQARSLATPVYRVVKAVGPDHDKEFTIEVLVGDEVWGVGVGHSKQAAQQAAAAAALQKLAWEISNALVKFISMLKIKLARFGKKHQAHYRIVVNEARDKRDGKYVALLGHYSPVAPKKLEIDVPAYEAWVVKGAQPTETVAALFKRFKSGDLFPVKKAGLSKKAKAKAVAAVKEASESKVEAPAAEEAAPSATEPAAETSTEEKA